MHRFRTAAEQGSLLHLLAVESGGLVRRSWPSDGLHSKLNRRATRVAVVTGAGAGIGKAIAERLAQGGVEVVGVDLAFGEEPSEGIRHEQVDVTDLAAMRQLIDDIAQQRGLDILVNNAAVIIARTVVDCAEDDYDRVMAVNVKAPFFAMQAAIPHMLEGRGARS